MSWINSKLNVLVLGTDGMLGRDVYKAFLKLASRRGSRIGTVYGMDRHELVKNRVAEKYGLSVMFMLSIKFDVCVNCMAMTDTKAAEETERGKLESYKLNALAPKYIAESCAFSNVHLIHISTDYVFSQNSLNSLNSAQYSLETVAKEGFPDERAAFAVDPFPVNAYGMHKLAGEKFVKEAYAEKHRKNWTVLRTSWLYGMNGSKSFVHRLLKNAYAAAESGKDSIEMTENEVSVPTSTAFLCKCIVKAALDGLYGVFHAVPKDGVVSRLEWSKRILAAFFADSEKSVFPRKVSVVGVKRTGMLQPEFSALKTSDAFVFTGTMAEDMQGFISENFAGITRWVSGRS